MKYFNHKTKKVIYAGKQQNKSITEIPKSVLRSIAKDYKWNLKCINLAQAELRRRINNPEGLIKNGQ
ncbi:MAG: hypothetical protein ACOC2E_00075 [Bacteroidota bacterium]